MPHFRSIDSDGNLITTFSGIITFKELHEVGEELAGYLQDGDVYELVLHTKDVEFELDSKKSSTTANNMNNRLKGPARAVVAFVADDNFVFGICRQLVLQTKNDFIRVSAFRTEEAARTWIHEMRLTQSQEPQILSQKRSMQ